MKNCVPNRFNVDGLSGVKVEDLHLSHAGESAPCGADPSATWTVRSAVSLGTGEITCEVSKLA